MTAVPLRALAAALALALLLPGAGCAARKRKQAELEAMSAEQLFARALEQLGHHDLLKARASLEKITFTAENRAALEPEVRLAIADAVFYAADDLSLIEARSKYLDFVTLYGDHPRAPYAQFQAGVASLEQVNHPSRDQTQTHAAIADLKEVQRRWPTSRYASASRTMIHRAEGNLAEHEVLVARFYYKRRVYPAAAARLKSVEERYPHYADMRRVYRYLGQSLILDDKEAEGRAYLDRLIAGWPESEDARKAKEFLAEGPRPHKEPVKTRPAPVAPVPAVPPETGASPS